MDIRGRSAIASDGDYTKIGGGNIPAGEVYIAPKKGSVHGKVVIDGTIKHRWGSFIVKKPVTLIIERGKVTDIKGGLEAKKLNKDKNFEVIVGNF